MIVLIKIVRAGRGNHHAARHAKVDQQRVAAIQIDQQIFRPPPQGRHRTSGQTFGQALRERAAQVGAADQDLRKRRAHQNRLQASANGFNLGKFGHLESRARRVFGENALERAPVHA